MDSHPVMNSRDAFLDRVALPMRVEVERANVGPDSFVASLLQEFVHFSVLPDEMVFTYESCIIFVNLSSFDHPVIQLGGGIPRGDPFAMHQCVTLHPFVQERTDLLNGITCHFALV